MDELVTAIVLCYNQSRFVEQTLESISNQIYQNIELIIVDDCSTDDSIDVIKRWPLPRFDCTFITHKKNEGICKSLNEALRLATGKYVSMVAGDDVWFPDKLSRQIELMEAQPEDVGVIYSDALLMDENSSPLKENKLFIEHHRAFGQPPSGRIFNYLLQGNFIPGMTALIRRKCYEAVGMYDETLPWEDWDMWLRIARHFSFVFSSHPSAVYRVHDKSFTHSRPDLMLEGTKRIVAKYLGANVCQ